MNFYDTLLAQKLSGGGGGGDVFGDFKNLVEGVGGTAQNPLPINIPEGITSLTQRVFLQFQEPINVVLPSTLTNISAYVFSGASGVKNITIKAETPPYLSDTALNNCYPNRIYVPSESVSAYKTASNWSAKASIIEAIPE